MCACKTAYKMTFTQYNKESNYKIQKKNCAKVTCVRINIAKRKEFVAALYQKIPNKLLENSYLF